MAKYDVAYLCGHVGEVQLFGKSKDRDRKLDWLADQLCWKCEREAAVPHAHVFIRFPTHDGKKCAQAVIDVVNSFKIKDALKTLRFRFEKEAPDACGKVLGLLAMTRPPAVWRRVYDLPSEPDAPKHLEMMTAALASVDNDARELVRAGLVEEANLHLELGGGGLTAMHAAFDPVMPYRSEDLRTTEDQ